MPSQVSTWTLLLHSSSLSHANLWFPVDHGKHTTYSTLSKASRPPQKQSDSLHNKSTKSERSISKSTTTLSPRRSTTTSATAEASGTTANSGLSPYLSGIGKAWVGLRGGSERDPQDPLSRPGLPFSDDENAAHLATSGGGY